MKTRTVWILALILALFMNSIPVSAAFEGDEFFVVDNYLEGMMQKYRITGVALAIVVIVNCCVRTSVAARLIKRVE